MLTFQASSISCPASKPVSVLYFLPSSTPASLAESSPQTPFCPWGNPFVAFHRGGVIVTHAWVGAGACSGHRGLRGLYTRAQKLSQGPLNLSSALSPRLGDKVCGSWGNVADMPDCPWSSHAVTMSLNDEATILPKWLISRLIFISISSVTDELNPAWCRSWSHSFSASSLHQCVLMMLKHQLHSVRFISWVPTYPRTRTRVLPSQFLLAIN